MERHSLRAWRKHRLADAAVWACGLAATLLVLWWTRGLAVGFLAAAGVALIACVAILRARPGSAGRGSWPLYMGLSVLVAVLLLGGVLEGRFERIEFDWPELAAEREARSQAMLSRRMSVVVERGRRAAQRAAEATAEVSRGAQEGPALFQALASLREQTGVDALVVFNESGGLRAWAGDHRGGIPDEVRVGATGASFVERPLFSYLYFSSPVQGRAERVVSALLVETGLVMRADAPADAPARRGVVETLRGQADVGAVFAAGPPIGEGAAWSLVEGMDTIVHARLEPVTQAELRAELEGRARAVGVVGAFIALFCLSLGWLRSGAGLRPRWTTALPLVAGALALFSAPLGAVLGLDRVYSPLLFVIPIPGDLTLGDALALLVPVGALVATQRPPLLSGRAYLFALGGGAVAIAVGYAGAIRLFVDAATPQLRQTGAAFWVGMHFAVVLLLAVLTTLALPRHRAPAPRRAGWPRRHHQTTLLSIAGLVLSALLGMLVLMALDSTRSEGTGLAALWAVPFLLCAAGGALAAGRSGRLLRWLTAGWLSITAVLPHLWVASANARLEDAGRELSSLGAEAPAILEFLLHEFGREAAARDSAGEQGLQLLYRSWVASGLAREPYGARIMLWSERGVPEVGLSLGGAEGSTAEEAIVWPVVRTAIATGELQLSGVSGLPEVSKVMAAPLSGRRAVSVSIPPRRTLQRPSAVAPFLGAPPDPERRLTLVEAQGSEVASPHIQWIRSTHGWRSEAIIRFPDGDYHAHLEVQVASLGMRTARGVLLMALHLALLSALWWLAHAARGRPPLPGGGLRRLIGSYRGRVTIALFGFFLAPTALFGYVAYRALAGEVERSAQRIAERAVRQAVAEFPQPTSDLRELALRAGTDVLRYLQGELTDVSSPETIELGVYGAWMPANVYIQLEVSGEETSAVQRSQLGQQSFLMAYHTVRPAGALAVPTALSAGEAALRQRELAHLILFAALMGAILSLALSVVVGRQLAGPIGRLRRAAAAVGAGKLKVRLPEPPGEFGQLFASFNRMTRRLRRARTQELRTARVLAWGEMARQIAHEIKNPLTPIKLAVQHLRRAYNDDRPDFDHILDENVEQILTEIDRLTEIARAFSRYGAPGELSGPLSAVDVGSVVHEALTLYRAGDPHVRYGEDVPRDLPAARARTGELKEVILNLLENARTALDGDGNVVVRAVQVDGRIELEVRDDGPGIPPHLLPRIFEPHFSTRSTGTGLGLAIVRRIVESWGGSVSAESEQGVGTTVRVRMVAAES